MSMCACGRGPVKVRSNGRSLGRCAECLSDAGGRFPVGTVRKHGRIWRRKTETGWEPCNEDGTPLPPVVRGTLAEIMEKYRLVPAPAQLAESYPGAWADAEAIFPDDPPADGPCQRCGGRGCHACAAVDVDESGRRFIVPLPAATGPTARADDPETSKAAGAAAADPARLTRNQLRVLASFEFTWGNDGYIAAMTEMHPGTVSKRRLELLRAGLVEHAWERDANGIEKPIVGPSPSGRPSYVWRITEAGRVALRAHAQRVA